MNRLGIIIILVGVLGLSSCASYERNYAGEELPREAVSFFFVETEDDTLVRGELEWIDIEGSGGDLPSGGSIAKTTFSQYGGALQQVLVQPISREIMPGRYAIKVRVTQNPEEEGREKNYGPYDLDFEARAGHLYCLKAMRKIREKSQVSKSQPDYEMKIEDVTSEKAYQEIVDEIKRVPEVVVQVENEPEDTERTPVRIRDTDKW